MSLFRPASVLLAAVLVTAVAATDPARAATGPTTLAVDGTVRVVVVDHFGEDARAEHLHTIETDSGAVIPVDLPEETEANARFEGELVVRGDVAADLAAKGLLPKAGSTIAEDTRAGRAAVASAEQQEVPLQVAESTVAPVTTAAAVAPLAHKAYVAVMTNRGTGAAPTPSAAVQTVTENGDYWEVESNGIISDFGVVGTPVSYRSGIAATNNSTCGTGSNASLNELWNEAADKFPSANFSAPGTHLIVLVNSSCTAGVGTVGESLSSGGAIVMPLGDPDNQTGVHELGHNFGLDHANLGVCPENVACAGEYYDVFSPMGLGITNGTPEYQPPALDSAFRARLGLTSAAEVPVASVASNPAGTVTRLAPRGSTTGQRGVEVVDPASGARYFVEYRSGTARDAGAFYRLRGRVGGLTYGPGVTVSTISSSGAVALLAPSSSAGSFVTGETFVSPTGAARVAVGAMGTAGADVTVTFGPAPPAAAPPAAAPPRLVASTPRISGTAKVGRTLRAKVGSWTPRPSYRYQWYANGKRITSKSTRSWFKPTTKQKGKRITVRVTGRKAGYATVSKTSRSTKRVANR